MENDTTASAVMDVIASPHAADAAAASAVTEELLVEEISIDGMCGVY